MSREGQVSQADKDLGAWAWGTGGAGLQGLRLGHWGRGVGHVEPFSCLPAIDFLPKGHRPVLHKAEQGVMVVF